MKEKFQSKNFRVEARMVIMQANSIIAEYAEQGYELTLRQLYYQFVSRDLIENKQSEYKRLGSIINDGRMAGLIDWDAIVDRTRNLNSPSVWDSPESIMSAVASQYREDLWRNQNNYCEVWVEKEALAGVVERACADLRVPFFACRGYVSQSEQWAAGKRLARMSRRGRRPITIFHLGDHDPSGIDMTRDNQDRLQMFAGQTVDLTVKRLALNMEQIEEYNPPPNPAKETDSRHAGYANIYGDESWELDALNPTILNDLIENNVKTLINLATWIPDETQETEERAVLQAATDRWDEVRDLMNRERDDL